MSQEIKVVFGPMRWADGRELTSEEEQAVKADISARMDRIFWDWEPTRVILDPLLRLWFKEGEPVPGDLEEIVYATRELWKLASCGASEDKRLAQLDEIQRMVLAGFARRRAKEEGGR